MKKTQQFFLLSLLIVSTVALSSCSETVKDLFSPKTDFYGVEKNATQYRLFVTDPSPEKQGKSWMLDPNNCFYTTVPGSSVIRSTASLPDGTIYAVLETRINQISNDATVNDSQVDWCWIIGGAFYACVSPAPGGSASASRVNVEIVNFASQLGVARPLVVVITPTEMKSLKEAVKLNQPATELERVTREIAGHYRLNPAQLLPTPKEN